MEVALHAKATTVKAHFVMSLPIPPAQTKNHLEGQIEFLMICNVAILEAFLHHGKLVKTMQKLVSS